MGWRVAEDAQYVAKELLDRMWTLYRDDIGLAAPEEREDYSRFLTKCISPLTIVVSMLKVLHKNGMTFIDLRQAYRDDPDFQSRRCIQTGQGSSYDLHRFWAQADIAI